RCDCDGLCNRRAVLPQVLAQDPGWTVPRVLGQLSAAGDHAGAAHAERHSDRGAELAVPAAPDGFPADPRRAVVAEPPRARAIAVAAEATLDRLNAKRPGLTPGVRVTMFAGSVAYLPPEMHAVQSLIYSRPTLRLMPRPPFLGAYPALRMVRDP